MTRLEKIVRRKTVRPESVQGHRQLIVMLEPGDILAMREEGRRITYRGSLKRVFLVLASWYAAEQRQLAAEKIKEKRRMQA